MLECVPRVVRKVCLLINIEGDFLMKKIIFLMLAFNSLVAVACDEDNSIENAGGPVTDGYSSSKPSARSSNRFSGELSSNFSGSASIECVDLGTITVSATYPGFGWSWIGGFNWTFLGSGGGGGGNNAVVPTQEKLDYCSMKDKAEALISALPVTGTVSTGLGIGQASGSWAQAVVNAALNDIRSYVGWGDRATISYTDGTINWIEANINWNQYDNWSSNQTLNPGNQAPTPHNGGSQHIFANFLQQTGQGNGTVNMVTANQDPQPHIDC